MILNEHVNENRDQRSRQEAEQVFRQGKRTPEAHRQRLFSGSLIAFHIAQIIDCENGDGKKSGGKPGHKNRRVHLKRLDIISYCDGNWTEENESQEIPPS